MASKDHWRMGCIRNLPGRIDLRGIDLLHRRLTEPIGERVCYPLMQPGRIDPGLAGELLDVIHAGQLNRFLEIIRIRVPCGSLGHGLILFASVQI